MARGWGFLAVLGVAGSAQAGSLAPAARARAVVDAQLAAITDPIAFRALLAPDTLIIGNGSVAVAEHANAAAIVALLGASPSQLPVLETEVTRLDAGGTVDAVWLTADITFLHAVRFGRTVTRDLSSARLTELVVADGAGWKVAALAFDSTAGTTAPGDALPAASTGPLTALLGSPYKLDAAVRDDPTTLATLRGDRVVGAAEVHRLLAPWRYRDAKTSAAFELRAKSWGFVIADVAIAGDSHLSRDPELHTRILLCAIADADRWRIVALHATP